MIVPPTISRFVGQIFFTKNEISVLGKVRIVKKNLVHVHGFPSSLANTEKLSQMEYFGQYGKIKKILLSSKTNTETNKKTFSVYITYSNEKEASFAILAVDSLLLEGKLIRAFFGTTKYCNYFLNNSPCPNEDKCMFLHKLVKDKDIIIDSNTIFSYNEHLNLAKKIIDFSNPETKKAIINCPKPKNTVFPKIDFIFLNEDQKEHFLLSSNISYIKSNSYQIELNKSNLFYNNYFNIINENYHNLLNNNFDSNNIYHKNLIKNKSIENFSINTLYNNTRINSSNNLTSKENCNKNINPNEPFEMHKIFKNSINHILYAKPFFIKINNEKLLKEIEFNYIKNELNKKGINIYNLLEGCLDCIKNLDNDN
jgi:hypothetical protein